jgi:hypothetical protein
MAGQPEQLPVLPDPRPPGECRACLRPIAVGEDYAVIRADHTGDNGMVCGLCWNEARGALVAAGARVRERDRQSVPGPPQP